MVKRYVNLTLVLSTTLFVISVVKISLVSLKLELPEDQFLKLSIGLEWYVKLCGITHYLHFQCPNDLCRHRFCNVYI